MKNGNKPAHPTEGYIDQLLENGFTQTGHQGQVEFHGLTKREYFAGLAMQGWIACQSENYHGDMENCIKRSVEYADALLKELEK